MWQIHGGKERDESSSERCAEDRVDLKLEMRP